MKDNFSANLFKTGRVVKVTVSAWGGRKKLLPEEIGIKANEVDSDLISLGSKWLIPKEEINDLFLCRSRANTAIRHNSFSFSFGTSFVPEKRLQPLKDELEKIKIDFYKKVESIKSRYDELREDMIAKWEKEANRIAYNRGDSEMQVNIMYKIRAAFPEWSDIENKFQFTVKEYSDFNQIAEEFVKESTTEIVQKVSEFAEKIKARLEDGNLSEKNLAPIREFVSQLSSGMMVFKNPKIEKMLSDLDTWCDADQAKDMKASAMSAMDEILNDASNSIDDIVKASIDSITSFKREIE
jgi:hypothetical protein